MDKDNFRKKLGITVALLVIIGIVLCFIGQFGLKDDRYTGGILSKLGVALIIISVIVGGIGTRVFQIKDAASVAKEIYKEHKERVAKDAPENLIDPVSGALKERKNDSIVIPLEEIEGKRIPNIAWFYIICLVLFLLLPTIGVVMFNLNKFLAGGLLFGFGVLSLVIMIIGNAIIMKKQRRNSQWGKYDNSARKLVGISNSMGENVSSNHTYSNKEVPVELSRTSASKAKEIWEMQKFAFADILRKYGDYDTSPANETIDKVKSRFEDPNTYHYFIKVKDQNVGVLRVVDPKTGEKKQLAQIFIMPEYRRNRYAYSAIKKAEKIHGEKDWEVETIFQEKYLTKFYMNLGYRLVNKTKRINPQMLLIYLEK